MQIDEAKHSPNFDFFTTKCKNYFMVLLTLFVFGGAKYSKATRENDEFGSWRLKKGTIMLDLKCLIYFSSIVFTNILEREVLEKAFFLITRVAKTNRKIAS